MSAIVDHVEVEDSYLCYCHEYSTSLLSIPFNKEIGLRLKMTDDPNSSLKSILKNKISLNIYTNDSNSDNQAHVGAACIVSTKNFQLMKSIIVVMHQFIRGMHSP